VRLSRIIYSYFDLHAGRFLMARITLFLLVLSPAYMLTIGCASAGILFVGGTATRTFDSGGSGTQVVVNSPMSDSLLPLQLNSTINTDDGTASAKSTGRHTESPTLHGIEFGTPTGVSQMDNSAANDMVQAATLTIDFSGTFQAVVTPFGPPYDGFVNFPATAIKYVVGNGVGFFARFDVSFF
jgi:hypothetical protein